jgi:ribosomal protein S18 acetylase RimI-like enzyme
MDSLPSLTVDVLDTAVDKQAALKLVADSIAQQRQAASYYLITRPLHLSLLFAFYAIVYAFNPSDITFTIVTASGLTFTYLLLIRFVTSDYIRLAEAFLWQSFIQGPNDENDVVLATRYGQEFIGTLVLRLQPAESKAVIRAWTVLVRYRGKGVGGDLLRKAVRVAREKCGRDCDVGFAADHANSAELVNSRLGRPFEIRDLMASRALSVVLQE